MTPIKDKIAALETRVAEMEAANKEAKAVAKEKGTKPELEHAPTVIYKLRRDLDALRLFMFLKAEEMVKDNPEMQEKLERFTDPGTQTILEVNEGDKITDLLSVYKDVKDIAAKLEATCEKQGLKIDFAKNLVVKA